MDDDHYIKIIKFLLSLKSPQNVYHSDVFSDVIKTENLRICKLFTKQRPTPTTKYGRETLLHTLAKFKGGSKKFTQGLLRQFEDLKEVLKKKNSDDRTPVYFALSARNLKFAEKLMDAGATFPNTNIEKYFSQTSFNPYPCNNLELFKFFAEYDTNPIDRPDKTLLHYLASGDEYYLAIGDKYEGSPVNEIKRLRIAAKFLEKRPDLLNKRDSEGKTALDLAVANNLQFLCALFVLKGANSQTGAHYIYTETPLSTGNQQKTAQQLINELLKATADKAVTKIAKEIFSKLEPLKCNSEKLIEEYLRREKK